MRRTARSTILILARASAVAALLVAPQTPAWAQPTPAPERRTFKWTRAPRWSVRLSVDLGPGWSACSHYGFHAERTLRGAVAALRGYDPFIPFEVFTHLEPNPLPGTDAESTGFLVISGPSRP